MRPLCETCETEPRAINYVRNGKTYYRSKCNACLKKQTKKKPLVPKWAQSGYRKKRQCEKCGFLSKYHQQILVMHVDGNLENVHYLNLKSVCLNCVTELRLSGAEWRRGDLVPDI